MRSITSGAKGGRPFLPAGACAAMRPRSSVQGITASICARKARLRDGECESGGGEAELLHVDITFLTCD